jgi:hypothetical protein
MEIAQVEGDEPLRAGFPSRKEVKVIVNRATAHAARFRFSESGEELVRVQCNAPELGGDPFAEQVGGIGCGEPEAETSAGEVLNVSANAWTITE